MADLVTHVCTALLPGAVLRSRYLPFVVVGTVLPDALGRAIPLALERVYGAGIPVPMQLLWAWSGLHEPFGAALACVVVALAFVERDRKRVLLALWAGCALHTGLDVLQDHHGEGYILLLPFSDRDFELGWIGSEATVAWAAPLALITAAAWLPAAVEATVGPPTPLGPVGRLGPWALGVLVVPVLIALAVAGPRSAAGCAAAMGAVTAATHRWWPGRTPEFVAVAAGWAAIAGILASRV